VYATVAILRRFLIELVRNPMNWISMIVFPVLFTLVFTVLPQWSRTSINVAVVDHDMTPVSHSLIQQMRKDPDLTVVPEPSEAAARQQMRGMKVDVILTIPKGFQGQVVKGSGGALTVTPSPNEYGSVSSATGPVAELKEQLQRWTLAGSTAVATARSHTGANTAGLANAYVAGLAKANQMHSPITTRLYILEAGRNYPAVDTSGSQNVVGFAMMFIIFSVFGVAGGMFEERRRGTWDRIKASPLPRSVVMAGYGIRLFVIGWLQFAVLYVTGLCFNVRIPLDGWGVLVVSLYILAVGGLALCVSGVVRSAQQQSLVGMFTAIVTSMLGGAYWPIDLEPEWMQQVAWFTPQNWVLEAMRTVAIGAGSFAHLAWPLAVLAGLAAVFFGAGQLQLRYA
jgi:ABC-2 type transport system permease protein